MSHSKRKSASYPSPMSCFIGGSFCGEESPTCKSFLGKHCSDREGCGSVCVCLRVRARVCVCVTKEMHFTSSLVFITACPWLQSIRTEQNIDTSLCYNPSKYSFPSLLICRVKEMGCWRVLPKTPSSPLPTGLPVFKACFIDFSSLLEKGSMLYQSQVCRNCKFSAPTPESA